MAKKIILAMLLAVLTLQPQALRAQDQLARPKALLTLRFISYLGWSDAAKQGDFVIGVIRDSELAGFLEDNSAGKKFGFQNVVVKSFKSVSDVQDCQVLFVSKNVNFARNADAIKAKVGKDTLIMTEDEGATKSGAMINFVIRDSRLKFELHADNAKASGITFSKKLTDMQAAINL